MTSVSPSICPSVMVCVIEVHYSMFPIKICMCSFYNTFTNANNTFLTNKCVCNFINSIQNNKANSTENKISDDCTFFTRNYFYNFFLAMS